MSRVRDGSLTLRKAAEYSASENGLVVAVETLRQWLIGGGCGRGSGSRSRRRSGDDGGVLRAVPAVRRAARAAAGDVLRPAFDAKFAVAPRSRTDLHRWVPGRTDLARVLAFQEERVVQNDHTLRWRNRWLQLVGKWRPRPGQRVTVCEQLAAGHPWRQSYE